MKEMTRVICGKVYMKERFGWDSQIPNSIVHVSRTPKSQFKR